MSVEIEFPIEFVVSGVPLSLQASTARKEVWKERIRTAARGELPDAHFAAVGPISVTIYYFSNVPVTFDLDNIVKPIFDALGSFVFVDDKQVERLVAQKFEPGRSFDFPSPSPKLAVALNYAGPRTYLQVDKSIPGDVI